MISGIDLLAGNGPLVSLHLQPASGDQHMLAHFGLRVLHLRTAREDSLLANRRLILPLNKVDMLRTFTTETHPWNRKVYY